MFYLDCHSRDCFYVERHILLSHGSLHLQRASGEISALTKSVWFSKWLSFLRSGQSGSAVFAEGARR